MRDIGKHLTMLYDGKRFCAEKRFSGEAGVDGMSFEFTYQLYKVTTSRLHLYKNNGVKLQMGGSDQWGNITTGTGVIRRKQR